MSKRSDSSALSRHEREFLPAQLEITESPCHPAPQLLAMCLLALTLMIAIVAAVGRLDIVATAPGKLIPNTHAKFIQTATTGVVRSIQVTNGEQVVAGQVLLELDPVQATADYDRARASRIDRLIEIERAKALLSSLQNHASPELNSVDGASQEQMDQVRVLAMGEFREYRAKSAQLTAELTRREAELAVAEEEIDKLQQTAPLARRQADDYKALLSDRYVASHEYLEKERIAIEQAKDLSSQRHHRDELRAAITVELRELDATAATFRREQLANLDKATQALQLAVDDEAKTNRRAGLLTLLAPVSGQVQQLNVHTIGGVVTTAQTLLEIVPRGALEVEAQISNKDIGFVSEGQAAKVKIATFPYTRYGYLEGKVLTLSTDAIQDKKLGAVFVARIRIPENRFWVENKWITLTPGMEVTVDIKTGTQKVWRYFLSPLVELGTSSLHER